ncbi:hypothetical protein EFE23_03380 [Micromonospora solifontis]|uniref:Uncharacterized protein n=2 Tax=Micromonosporaceae TaxID=28056 RepID=A0ABX9WL59_9ACTN|nr:hypothetical protein EFE23_03380 [Micromonospora solifontis]
MDQETVERLLIGSVADAPGGPEVLVRLLAAVRAAPHPHELTGEAAALQAFRLARAGSPVVPASRPERRWLTGLLGAKVALAALLAAATGGVALAAATGTLPGPLGHGPDTTPSAGAGSHPSRPSGPDASATPGADRTARPGNSASLTGLCNSYRNEPGGNAHKTLESPRFAELVTAAGGRDEVAGYCDRLLGERGKPSASNAGGTKRPDPRPSDDGTGQPKHTPSTPAVTVTPTSRPSEAADPANRPASVGPTQH